MAFTGIWYGVLANGSTRTLAPAGLKNKIWCNTFIGNKSNIGGYATQQNGSVVMHMDTVPASARAPTNAEAVFERMHYDSDNSSQHEGDLEVVLIFPNRLCGSHAYSIAIFDWASIWITGAQPPMLGYCLRD
ncbi:hypothetical protein MLD38_036528 [Melastoma candidum]|uniref:Uncharacterized protein n=1 Tax=Melastoma candidum TaxID=119954 RepID=A0ACB9LJZ8_9MYRT|nr:hypothetical protein MLD38_036528 [Melastoma candidum]